ncbi:MAG: HAD-IC family P-type ATPase [Patescibacteria group bacterium]
MSAAQREKLWHSCSAKDVLKILQTSPNGLSPKEVSLRREKYGRNIFKKKKQKRFWGLLIQQVKSPLVFILLVAGSITLILGAYADSLVIFIAVSINTAIGIFQEGKASQAFDKLRDSQKKYATVIREGKKLVVPAEDLVPGDILVLSVGDQILADARILDCKGLEVNESVLTGEWIATLKNTRKVKKETAISERSDMVYMNTLITEGWATSIVVSTGFKTEVGKIAKMIGEEQPPPTSFQKNVKNIAKVLSWIVLGILIFIFGAGIFRGVPVSQMLFTSVAIAVAAIPEGLPVAVSVVLAVGMQRILQRGGLVKKLGATETLGSVDIILTDKTGTLTQAVMRVSDIITLGSLSAEKKSSEKVDFLRKKDDRTQVLKMGILCSDGFIENPNDNLSEWIVRGRPIEQALIIAGMESGLYQHELLKEQERTDFLSFDSGRRFSASLHKRGKDSQRFYISGAPEYVLSLSDRFYKNGKTVKLTKSHEKQLIQVLEKQTSQGARVIAIGYKDTNLKEFVRKDGEGFEDCVFGGFVIFHDPLRPDVKRSVHKAKLAGVRTVMVTGDHKQTAKKIGEEVNIYDGGKILTGEDLEKMSDKELLLAIQKTSVFARVLPAQKLRIVRAWQKGGNTVAMTGDGINDSPALRRAEVGIALNSGTDVAKESSEIVLLNNSFSVIVSAIEEGRRILLNLRKILIYLLSTGLSEIVLVGTALVAGFPLPLLPAQILWTNLIEEGFMNFAFAFEPKEKNLMKLAPRDFSSKKLLTNEGKNLIFLLSFFTSIILLALFFIFHLVLRYPIEHTRTVIFLALSMDSIFFVFSLKNFKKPIWRINIFSNIYLIGAVLMSFVFLVVALFVPFVRNLLSLEKLTNLDILIGVFIGILNLFIIETAKHYLFNKKSREKK